MASVQNPCFRNEAGISFFQVSHPVKERPVTVIKCVSEGNLLLFGNGYNLHKCITLLHTLSQQSEFLQKVIFRSVLQSGFVP